MLLLILIIVTYFYLKLKYSTRYGPIPGLSPEIFFGNMRQTGMITLNESIPNINFEFQSKYGDIYQFWMDAVIKEVLRFSPPSNGTVDNDRLQKTGFQLYKNEQITIPFYCLTRDQRCWKIDPNIFYSERFLNENHDPYVFIPFGGGHRQCIHFF